MAQIGVVFPQTEIGADPQAVRDYAQAAEELGYEHLLAYDHVLGANALSRPGWPGPYDHTHMFHEPFVLFGHLAGLTTRIRLTTGIIILPQRQTALVAKQAAEVDVLSGGRLRLGVAVGWNAVEYEALGQNFRDRGVRSEEQVEVLRLLWTNPLVTFRGRWHRITDAGLNPLPVQRPIPIWFGGGAEAVIARVGRLGDGWLPEFEPDDEGRARLERMRAHARAGGRDPHGIAIERVIAIRDRTPKEWLGLARAWEGLGASYVAVDTMRAGLSPREHIDAIRRYKAIFDNR